MLKIDKLSLTQFSSELKQEVKRCGNVEELLLALYKNFKVFFKCDFTIPYRYFTEDQKLESVTNPKLQIDLNRFSPSLIGTGLKTTHPIVENRVKDSFLYNQVVDNPLKLAISHLGTIPIVRAVDNSPIGIVVCYRKEAPFSRVEFHQMETFTALIKQALRENRKFKVLAQEANSNLNFKLQYLKATERLKSSRQFFFSIIHDIRTPLNAMMGFLQLLLQQEEKGEKQEFIKSALHSGKMIISLINDLLDMAKLEEGKLQIEKVYFTPITLFEATTNLFYFAAKNKGVELIGKFDPKIPFVLFSDNYRLQQILNNLLSNGVKFTPPGGKIYFSLNYQSEGKVQFSVKDTGIGIPKEAQSRLFKPYEQVGAETSKKFGGTGLGLYISHKLVSMLGGELKFISKEGEGTQFFFSIPVGDLEPKELPPSLEKSLYPYRPITIFGRNFPKSWLEQLIYYLERMELPYFLIQSMEELPPEGIESKALFLHRKEREELKKIQKLFPSLKEVVLFAEIGEGEGSGNKIERELDGIKFRLIYEPITPKKVFISLSKLSSVDKVPTGGKSLNSDNTSDNIEKKGKSLRTEIVLIADDDPISRNLMVHLFKSLKVEVIPFPNGKQLYDYFKKILKDNFSNNPNPVKLILLDQNMPEMDGIETIRALRHFTTTPPIYLLSGEEKEELKKRLKGLKVDGIITKPVNLSQLEKIIFKNLTKR